MKKGVKKEKEEITIKMLEEGIDEKIILKVTSLTLEEIEKIKERLKRK